MENKTYNIYCDESCHLLNDHKQYMLIGSVLCPYCDVRGVSRQIREIMDKHNMHREIKWTSVSPSKLDFYKEVIQYFFDSRLDFRAIVVDKTKYDNEITESYDDFYYKMYYLLLNNNVDTMAKYNLYLDIKDTLSAIKVRKLKEILNTKYGVYNNVQSIRSDESCIMQLCDLIMGAISYNVNVDDKASTAKKELIEQIRTLSGIDNISVTNRSKKLNLFFIKLKENATKPTKEI